MFLRRRYSTNTFLASLTMPTRRCPTHGLVETSDERCPTCQWQTDMAGIMPAAMDALTELDKPAPRPSSAAQPLLGDGNWVKRASNMGMVAVYASAWGLALLGCGAIAAGLGSIGSCGTLGKVLAYLIAGPLTLAVFAGVTIWWYRVFRSGMIPTLAEERSCGYCSMTAEYWEREDSGYHGYLKTLKRDSSRPMSTLEPIRYAVCHLIYLMLAGVALMAPFYTYCDDGATTAAQQMAKLIVVGAPQ